VERDLGIGMLGGEPLDDRADARTPRADALPRFVNVRPHHARDGTRRLGGA